MSGNKKSSDFHDSIPYGDKCDTPQQKQGDIKRIMTFLNGNPVVASRLANALRLKDIPGHPPAADMSRVDIVTDFFQAGFANFTLVNKLINPAVTTFAVPVIAAVGWFAGPLQNTITEGHFDSNNPEASPAAFGTEPIFRNYEHDLRVLNAWVRWFPSVNNPVTDTNPHSIHCEFLVDNVPVFEQIQNNLVSSAADFRFMSQTADSYWPGIVPARSEFRFRMFISNNAGTGADTMPAGDAIQFGMTALAVPFGAQLPV